MRTSRIVEDRPACYHIISRVVDRRMVFDAAEKERFRSILRAVEAFSGVQVLTYALLDNHWHILVHVPERHLVADDVLLERLARLYGAPVVAAIAARLADLRARGQHEAAETLKAGYSYRMYDLSEFAKTLKQRVSQSYNRRHGRKGTLWEERFKSVLVGEGALTTVAAYIDLNAVRAGIVGDPREYRFCGYGEALGGSALARQGLCRVLGRETWSEAAGRYRQMLYLGGGARVRPDTGHPIRPGFRAGEVDMEVAHGGELPLAVLLRCRVRYFSDGAILGSRVFVEDAFQRHRAHFSAARRTGARRLKGGAWGDVYAARALRLHVLSPPAPA